MLNLRLAAGSDLETIVDFSSRLIQELPYRATPDRNKIAEISHKVINGNQNESLIILLCQDDFPVGVLGCAVSEPLFCQAGEKMAVELLLYISEDYRNTPASLMLIRAYKYWARLVGCTYISYASYKNGIEHNRVMRLK